MQKRLGAAAVLLALTVSACGGGAGGSTPSVATNDGAKRPAVRRVALPAKHASIVRRDTASTNLVTDAGFESGGFSAGWYQCGNVNAAITKARVHSGMYSDFNGASTTPEVNGYSGLCQDVTVPSNGTLSFWVYEGTNDTVNYADQEADLLDSSGYVITTLYYEAANTNGWVQKSFDLSHYAGQSVSLFVGVYGNGWSRGYIYQYVDDVFLGANGATPTPAPSATPTTAPTPTPTGAPTPTPTGAPTPTPTVAPTPTPTVAPTPTPTVAPTPTPTGLPYPCNDTKFSSDQSAFASGSLSGDQLEDVCGSVTQVLPSKTTSSGLHGYFYVKMPSGYNIEIVSNLDAMAQASTDQPPSTWPWVSVGQYVYVQGRYYYDNASSQGIDWTEDDTGSWPYVGWVSVCDSNGNNCQKYW
ncbi:MAG TPA: hypothetical protein VNF68_03560 [Candidatus Baltobacteraceae bacterium]|nr:hypothetical protein [Candidatus Baltobacteraceae bacterium]